jgi:hypothetical protein
MNDNAKSDDVFCDSLLTPQPDAIPEGFQRLVLAQTLGVLRRRRRLRRLAAVAALAACFLGGVLAMRFFGSPGVPPPPEQREEMVQRQPEPNFPLTSSPKPADSALALEWQALDSPTRRPDLDRKAGDRYLTENFDARSAMRCYDRALAADADLSVSADDSWLLMAIKDARQKEKRDAKNGS